MVAIDGLVVLLVGLSTLLVALGMAASILKLLLARFLERA